jgi:hypothetical protein
MIEHAINFIASFNDVPRWAGLEVNGYAILMGALFLLVTLSEVLMALYDGNKERKKEKKVFLPQATRERFAH